MLISFVLFKIELILSKVTTTKFSVFGYCIFLEEISLLSHDISRNASPKTTIIIGLDANTSLKSSRRRQDEFLAFKTKFSLETILPGYEPTFHHNNGSSESQIDHILTNNKDVVEFDKQLCKNIDGTNWFQKTEVTEQRHKDRG